MRYAPPLIVAAAFALQGCDDSEIVAPIPTAPAFEIVDGANAGNKRFFFLPPMVAPPTVGGVFDGSLKPEVRVCEWTEKSCREVVASFTTATESGSETVRVVPDDEHYVVNWHLDEYELSLNAIYRIVVLVAGTELGHADVDIVGNGGELRNVETDEYIGLVDGRTLPVKFRIEEGAVFVVDSKAKEFVTEEGRVTMKLPAGALSEGTEIGVTVEPKEPTPETEQAQMIPGSIYEFGPDGTEFNEPVELTLAYDEAMLPEGVDEDELRLYTRVGEAWVPLPGIVDTGANTVSGRITGFSAKAIGGPLSAGGLHSCVVGLGGEAYCWGANYWGQAGNGSFATPAAPGQVVGGLTFQFVDAGEQHSCGLTANGVAYCWGINIDGRLGIGSFSDIEPYGHPVPESVVGGLQFTQLALGGLHTCGLTADGSAYCWGWNSSGQLGAGFAGGRSAIPVPVRGGLSFASLSAGFEHTCGVLASGAAFCWGSNYYGQLGNGSGVLLLPMPVQVQGGPYQELAAGFMHNCAVTKTGEAQCWGNNSYAELGRGSQGGFVAVPTPVAAPLQLQSIDTQYTHTCGLDESGKAYCWGSNGHGQVGSGSGATYELRPVAVATPLTFSQIVAGAAHTCAVTAAGQTYCWGAGNQGALGDGGGPDSSTPVLVEDLPPLGVQVPPSPPNLVAAGERFSCVLRNGGETWCWGDNAHGQLGNGTNDLGIEPERISGDPGFVSLTASSFAACGLTTSGSAYCWGNGIALGDGTGASETTPVPVSGGLSFQAVDGGGVFNCGLTTAGETYCWGSNASGQLGNGSTSSSYTPALVATGGLEFVRVTAGAVHACALTEEGEAYCWGDNSGGQLGTAGGPGANRTTPQAVAGGHTFRAIEAGNGGTCALTISDDLYCWGNIGSTSGPKLIDAPEPFVDLTTSAQVGCAIGESGTAYCWGQNNRSQLGSGSSGGQSAVPIEVAGGRSFAPSTQAGVSALASGTSHSCAVDVAGEVVCWGWNIGYQLGDGTKIDRNAPEPVRFPVELGGALPASAPAMLSAGHSHVCSIEPDGTYCWGQNLSGELGDGSTSPADVPSVVLGAGPFIEVATASSGTCALEASGRTWCWGSQGILGSPAGGPALQPQVVPGLTVDRIWAGASHVCGLDRSTGEAFCWGGTNQGGELGQGLASPSQTPVQVIGNLEFHELALGSSMSCGLTRRGDAYCWGNNAAGRLGTGGPATVVPSPQRVATALKFIRIAAGLGHVCALAEDAKTHCWGTSPVAGAATPLLSVTAPFASLASGHSHACGIDEPGQASCWGRNLYGQLGNGAISGSAQGVGPVVGPQTYTELTGGAEFTCGRASDGQVYCWGANNVGQLGIGTTGDPEPTPTMSLTPFGS